MRWWFKKLARRALALNCQHWQRLSVAMRPFFLDASFSCAYLRRSTKHTCYCYCCSYFVLLYCCCDSYCNLCLYSAQIRNGTYACTLAWLRRVGSYLPHAPRQDSSRRRQARSHNVCVVAVDTWLVFSVAVVVVRPTVIIHSKWLENDEC